MDRVNYDALDKAKNAFIEASRKTLGFAEKFGFVPNSQLGASANLFTLNLKPYLTDEIQELHMTLLPEGLGTADDARPNDLTPSEEVEFWRNIAGKTLSCLTNDAASAGLQTILVSLYLPSSDPEVVFSESFMSGFLDGFVAGCRKIGCVYLSGETPQLKGKIIPGKIDIAGALVGIVPPGQQPITSAKISAGNYIVFLGSTGPHENGFTTLRKMATELPQNYRTKLPSGMKFWRAINQPGHLYTPIVQNILKAGVEVTNIEPITGHGWQKLMRPSIPLEYHVEQTLAVPEIFAFIQEEFSLTPTEMVTIFNYGVGLALFTETLNDAEQAVAIAKNSNIPACVAGQTRTSTARIISAPNLGIRLTDQEFTLRK